MTQWEHGDQKSGSTNPVIPFVGCGIGEGKIEFNESFRLPVTLLRVMHKGGDGDTFQRNFLEFHLCELRRDKMTKGSCWEHPLLIWLMGVVKDTPSINVQMNAKRSFSNTAQPVLFIKICHNFFVLRVCFQLLNTSIFIPLLNLCTIPQTLNSHSTSATLPRSHMESTTRSPSRCSSDTTPTTDCQNPNPLSLTREYFALTRARLNGKEVVAGGLATHFVPSEANIMIHVVTNEMAMQEMGRSAGEGSNVTLHSPSVLDNLD
ncbi:hypothetical protein Vadar_024133 [Vaccinium darrowii]|uniref:Uncharacterized protein n=1 Tax=Vaccinium darrowii TaxID=229202 RepID=A0ACB7YXU7_9ERIC|nr:hypothetical protein Vadar_024133 [Vaccinium darrowii]